MVYRILHVVTDMNMGGIETLIMTIYRKIDRSKVQFDFLMHKKKKSYYDDEILSLGGKIFRLNYSIEHPIKYRRELTVFFKNHREYSIIHSHRNALSYFVVKAAYDCNVPIRIAHSHSAYPKKSIIKTVFDNYCRRRINNVSTYRFACSSDAATWLFGSSDNALILKNGINVSDYVFDESSRENLRSQLRINDHLVFGHVGRFDEPKNHTFIIDIFRKIRENNNNAVLLLIGDGDLKESIIAKCDEYGLSDSVIFTGVVGNVYEMMQAMDIFLFPSLYEGLGIVLIEAQASGLKCLISDKIPKEAIVTNLCTVLPLDDSDKWVNAALCNCNYTRRDMTKNIVDAGYSIGDVAEKLQNFYINAFKELEQERGN